MAPAPTPLPRRVMLAGLLLWSLSLIATGAVTSLPSLLAVRTAFGLASACAMPATSSVAARWVPPPLRTTLLGLIYLFFSLGGVLGLLLTPGLTQRSGWQQALATVGAGGVMWALIGGLLLQQAYQGRAVAAGSKGGGQVPGAGAPAQSQQGSIKSGSSSSSSSSQTIATDSSSSTMSDVGTEPSGVQPLVGWQAALPQVRQEATLP